MTQTNAQPEGDHTRTYLIAGLAVIGLGLGLLLQDSLVRENCRRVLRDPKFRGACRDAVVTAVASSPSEVGDGATAVLSPSAY